MLHRRSTLRVWTALVLLYFIGAALATYFSGDTRELLAFAGLPPFMLAHLLHKARVPGMLEHGGLCGWGWCEPTLLGWIAAVALMALVLWPVAAALSWLWRRAPGGTR